jgi:hypothetical protein
MTDKISRRNFLKLLLASAPATLISTSILESELAEPAPVIKPISGRGVLHTGKPHVESELIIIGESIFVVLEDSPGGSAPVAMVSTGVSDG